MQIQEFTNEIINLGYSLKLFGVDTGTDGTRLATYSIYNS
jgi:hypothetical protein